MTADDQRTDVTALREALAAATPGPWEHRVHVGKSDWTIGEREVHQILPNHLAIAGAGPDATLIVAAVNALPTLLDELEELRFKADVQAGSLTQASRELDAARATIEYLETSRDNVMAAAERDRAALRAERDAALAPAHDTTEAR